MNPYQKIEIPLQSVSFSAGGTATIDFGAVMTQMAGRIAHIPEIKFVVSATPTQSSGTATAENLQKAVRSLVIRDGTGRMLFSGSFASLRLYEALERGYLAAPENDAAATTEAVNFERVFSLAPRSFEDDLDFVQPAALFKYGGSITFGFGALTDVTATTTALSMTIQAYAVCTLHDEVLLGSLVERFETSWTNGMAFNTEALYTEFALAKSNAFATISAGDFANVQVLANGLTRQAIHVADLERMFHHDKGVVSGVTLVHGEPRAATDDNPKVVNGTALAAAPAQLSPVLWSPQSARISKLVYGASPTLVVQASGSSSGYALTTRLLPRTAADVGKAEACVRAGLAVGFKSLNARTLSKKPYDGPRRAYMPLKAKVG